MSMLFSTSQEAWRSAALPVASRFTSAALLAAVTSAGAPSPREVATLVAAPIVAAASTPLPPAIPSALILEQRRPPAVSILLDADQSVGHTELKKARFVRAIKAPRQREG